MSFPRRRNVILKLILNIQKKNMVVLIKYGFCKGMDKRMPNM